MKISSYEGVIDVQIDFDHIAWKDAIDDDGIILIPYDGVIDSLVNGVIDMAVPLWKTPDYEKSKMYFYINDNEIALSVEVFPKRFSDEERTTMLQLASRDFREDGYSDYLDLMDMFNAIDFNLDGYDPCGIIGVYNIQLTVSETNKMKSILSLIG